MLKSAGRRFIVVGFLVLLMFIPLMFAGDIIQSRKDYSQSTIAEVGKEWGGQQTLVGPYLVIPVEKEIVQISTRPKLDPVTGVVMTDATTGDELVERFEEVVVRRSDSVYLLPREFNADLSTKSEIRARGIFQVPVFQAEAKLDFNFDVSSAPQLIGPKETLLWNRARIVMRVTNNRALRGDAEMTYGGQALALEPLSGTGGFRAAVGDPREAKRFALTLGFNGAQKLFIAPVGRDSQISMTSDWPHPSFGGAFLPDAREISDTGFTATWSIPHLARPLPQIGRNDPSKSAQRSSAFGVNFVEPNDFYQKAYRAANYGILFIALTFLTILLIERGAGKPVHAVQYILVGLTQSVFVLLMVAYAEQIGFAAAYAVSAGAVIALLTLFGFIALKLGKRALVLAAMLITVYAVLYLILNSADYALMAGSTLAFAAIALTMWATRNEDWFGPEKEARPGLMARMFAAPARPDQAKPAAGQNAPGAEVKPDAGGAGKGKPPA